MLFHMLANCIGKGRQVVNESTDVGVCSRELWLPLALTTCST